MLKHGFGDLELPRATVVARLLGGSIAWLAGCEPDPEAPPTDGITLDVAGIRQIRRARKVPEQAIRDHIGLTANEWRRLLAGRDQPRLRELVELAGLLATHPHRLLTTAT